MSCPTLTDTFDGTSVIFSYRNPEELLDDTIWESSPGEQKVQDSYMVFKAELRILCGEIPSNGHIGVNLHQYLKSYQENFEEDSCTSALCAEKSFRLLQKAERLVNNIKHAAACVIQKKLFWPWRTRLPMLRQPNVGFEFMDWTKEELEAEVEWYRQRADQYSVHLLQMHGYDTSNDPIYSDVTSMTCQELIEEIEEKQTLLNDCDAYLMQTQKEYEEDMYWQDFEWRKLERDRISGIMDKAKMIAEANRCYIGGWEQLQKDLKRENSFENPEEISDEQWKEWTKEDRNL